MKKQNKISTIIGMSSIIGIMLLSPTTILPIMGAGQDPSELSVDQLKQTFPKPLSNEQIDKIKQMALENDSVKSIINGHHYKFMAQDFVGNYKTQPGIWQPEVHINVDNKTEISIVTDSQINSVASMATTPLFKLGPGTQNGLDQSGSSGHAFAIDEYAGAQSSIYGVKMLTTGPSYSGSGTIPFKAFMVNGAETGATDADLCVPAYDTTSYFAQAGIVFIDDSAGPVWTDTDQSCLPVVPHVTYTPGDHMVFEVISGSPWVMYGADSDSGSTFFDQSNSIATYGTMETGDPNTSIFFENSDTGTSWSSQISNPSAAAKYMNSNTQWVNWDGETKNDQDCHATNHVYTYDSTKQVINGTGLDSGNTATWSMSRMASNYPAC
ncbi:MAG: hypothetical protein KGI02_03525 [Thaumarchaeota archaeon]|nr:hypothetical protein [Nitrososphaerota archaeon]MDE1877867.1 hypothetical protein [Nitrososphaerota archaeon]